MQKTDGIRPLGNLCLVKPLEKENNGILLPTEDEVMPDRGTVKAIGPKVTDIKIGDTVFFDRIRVDNIRDRTGKMEYLFIPEDLIYAIGK